MRRTLLPALLVFLSALTSVSCRPTFAQEGTPFMARRTTDIELPADSQIIEGLVPDRSTLAGMLHGYDVQTADRVAVVEAVGDVFDLRRVRAGQPFTLDRLLDGRVRTFAYEVNDDARVVVDAVAAAATFVARLEPIAKDVQIAAVEGVISRAAPSLTQALDAVGERLDLAIQMADIFSGELDFSSDLQPGDRFRLLVERKTREGEFAGYGAILAAEFINADRPLRAVRFESEGGAAAYFDEQGRSLKRFFLKTPLKFEPRITSRFSSARRHPVLNYTRAHNGVDYAAPSGAAIVAVAPGVVTLAGWTSGGGRTVKVRHANGYESEYLHMSALDVRAGHRVAQGELLGKVGATGLATGPHLHYGLRKNGAFVNPVQEHQNMPPGEPVQASALAMFAVERDRLFDLMVSPAEALRAHDH